jgi:hypothetical protein
MATEIENSKDDIRSTMEIKYPEQLGNTIYSNSDKILRFVSKEN